VLPDFGGIRMRFPFDHRETVIEKELALRLSNFICPTLLLASSSLNAAGKAWIGVNNDPQGEDIRAFHRLPN
jgi:hypothetical protein